MSHRACGQRKLDPSFCHSQHSPIKEVFLMWWVCYLTQRASFTAHWWSTPALLHEGILNIGCLWMAGSWIFLRRPHALYAIHLLRYFQICLFCVIYQLSAVQLRGCYSNLNFHCLPEENILRIQPHDFSFRMFTSKTSLTSEYCKEAKCPRMPKLRWSTVVAEFWSGEWDLKVQDMKRDENQSGNLRHLKPVCVDGLLLLSIGLFWNGLKHRQISTSFLLDGEIRLCTTRGGQI